MKKKKCKFCEKKISEEEYKINFGLCFKCNNLNDNKMVNANE